MSWPPRINNGLVLTDSNSPSQYITSDEGKILQKAMWNEVVGVLEEKVPRVKEAIASLSG